MFAPVSCTQNASCLSHVTDGQQIQIRLIIDIALEVSQTCQVRNIFCSYVFFFNLPPFRFILKIFRFFLTLLIIATYIDIMLFGDVKTEKQAHSVSPADKNIAIFSEHKILPCLFAKRTKIFCLYFIKCCKVKYRVHTLFGTSNSMTFHAIL